MTDINTDYKKVIDTFPQIIEGYEHQAGLARWAVMNTVAELISVTSSILYTEQSRNALIDDITTDDLRRIYGQDITRLKGIGRDLYSVLERAIITASEWESVARRLKAVQGR